MGKLTRTAGQKLYLDANLFIYALEAVEPWVEIARQLFDDIDKGVCSAVTSELSLAESLVKPFQLGRHDVAETYLRLFQTRQHLRIIPVTRDVIVEAAKLRAASRMKLPDAIHAATGVLQGCTTLLTNDDRFKDVPELQVLFLRDLL